MYYFIGIKGSGMAPLAEILHELGNEVCGSDIDKYIFIEEELRKRNIQSIHLMLTTLKMVIQLLLEMLLVMITQKLKLL